MDEQFSDLRRTLCSTDEEMRRFRQLVNTVMATDIWTRTSRLSATVLEGKAFQEAPNTSEPACDTVNRKATIVIEHLIQASDIAHTMQHWHFTASGMSAFRRNVQGLHERSRREGPVRVLVQGEIGFSISTSFRWQ
jgi:hypothetical protein